MKKTLLLCLALSSLAACSQNVSPNTYTASEVGVANKVVPGVVVSKRQVAIDNNSGAGGVAGATAGAAAGTLAGNNAATSVVGAVGGAVVGGIIGNSIDQQANKHLAYEYMIKLHDKHIVSIVQAEDLNLAIRQRVLIIYGATTRIVPDEIQDNA
jgi:outer membrane lipoprotein SlyB